MGNYEGYSKPTGAMGDRMSAMKSAFQVIKLSLTIYSVSLKLSLFLINYFCTSRSPSLIVVYFSVSV